MDFVIRKQRNELLPIEVKYQDKTGTKDFLNLEKVNRQKGIIVSKDDFSMQNGKWIIPVDAFLLMDWEKNNG